MTRVPRAIGIVLAVSATLTAVLPRSAYAQEPSGMTGGLSIGGGWLRLGGASADPATELVQLGDRNGGGPTVDLRLGRFVAPRAAVLRELALATTSETAFDDTVGVRLGGTELLFGGATTDLSSFVTVGAAQFWVAPRVWIRGGIGVGYLSRTLYLPDSVDLTLDKGYGFAVLGGTGVEVWRVQHLALDAQVQFSTFAVGGLRVNAPVLQLGVSFW
ncbi:MAG: hypothetical protein OEW19_11425 [Acidobacteriota bacterium]|nr:hypothetical protein [Acidobacteriota bacterium]